MDEKNKPQLDPMDETGADNDNPSSPRVFDFSSDFNILPVKDEPGAPIVPPVAPVAQTPKKPVPPIPPPAPKESVSNPPSYRETVETDAKWPFAFGKTDPNQASMITKPKSPIPPATQAPTSPFSTSPFSTSPTPAVPIPVVPIPIVPIPTVPIPIVPTANPAAGLERVPRSFPFSERPDTDLKNLRTYESDVADVLAHRKTSTASIAIAESKKQSGEERLANSEKPGSEEPSKDEAKTTVKTSSGAGLKTFYIIVGLVLIGGGAIGGYYLYTASPLFLAQQPAPPVSNPAESLVPSDARAVVIIDDLDANAIRTDIQAELGKPQSPNTIKEIILVKSFGEILTRVEPVDAAKALKLPVPDILARTLTPSWMIGIYADPSGMQSAFVAVRSDLFQNAFAGMLEWEATIANNIAPYTRSLDPAPRGQFRDEIVKNKDVRAFVDTNGQTLFVYSFLDNWTLVIAENGSVLGEIESRLENRVFIR